MYNRYIPQSDGSYKRKTMPEKISKPPNPPENSVSCVDDAETTAAGNSLCTEKQTTKCQCRECQKRRDRKYIPEMNASSFLKELLPKDLDTGDLLIIVMLLLISADNADDQGNALLTLAIYLFL